MSTTSLSLSSAILSQGADVHSTLPGLEIVVCSRALSLYCWEFRLNLKIFAPQ